MAEGDGLARLTDPILAIRYARHRILLCYGLLGEVMAGLKPVGIDYMARQHAWLRGLGLDAQVVRLPTAAPVAANARRVAAAVRGAPGPVILVAHSKGGLEALAALLRPDVAARCQGFIALQSPFFGSPVADALLRGPRLRRALDHLARRTGLGSGRGLTDLTTTTRVAWMARHAVAIAAMMDHVPVITLATTLEGRMNWQEGVYGPLARWIEQQGSGPSDGLVPVASALLPGARQAVLPGGHRALVPTSRGRDPIGVLRAELLALSPSPPPRVPIPHLRSP